MPDYAQFIRSVRHTTSSRRPGVDVVGTVRVRYVPLQVCPDCGVTCSGTVEPGRHAPHWASSGPRRLLNCVGEEVR